MLPLDIGVWMGRVKGIIYVNQFIFNIAIYDNMIYVKSSAQD